MTTERTSFRPPCRSLLGIRVVGTGKYVPDMVVDNHHLQARFGFDSEWIVKRTGILERRHAAPNQATSDLCVEAVYDLFAKTGRTAKDCDLLVLGTFTPDMSFPSTACLIQDRIGMIGPAIEVEAACAGFMYALITAAAYVKAGLSQRALVIGGDTNSRVLNPTDIKTYPLFGDGAGAVFVEPGCPDQGILAYSMGSEGWGGPLLQRQACGSRMPITPELIAAGKHYMHMDGHAVFKWAVNILCDTIRDVLDYAQLTVNDVDLFVAHQANIRIINAAIDALNIPRSKVYNNLERYGNTSAGSIPIALDEAAAEGRFREGDLLVLSGFGAGLTWGTALLRW
ncbi:MAG: beta-ketoacyl-ACP synthase III [Gemmataceae bacterium]|nr:ketoacyl-ACP synthase III [Gemmata sp.]MDW8196417.1 beta-ketoacyl-ACP synthase III [Gemmataceae bacterium]